MGALGIVNMDYLYIVGAGGLGMELIDLLRSDHAFHHHHWTVGGFIDTRSEKKGQLVCGAPVIGGVEEAPFHEKAIYCIAVGDVHLKKQLVEELVAKSCRFVSIRTRCSVGSDSEIGNAVLQQNVTISVKVKVGDYVYLDSNSTVGHEVTIGNYSHIGRGVFIGGRSVIGELVTIHPGAMIANDITIGNGAIIGLGSVVLRDVPEGATVMGNPGRIIK